MPNPDDILPTATFDASPEAASPVLNFALANPVPMTLEEQVLNHPESNRQRAVLILTDCMAELSRSEAMDSDPPEMMFFSVPPGAKIGKNGFVSLFPDMDNSPVGKFRGNGMSCDLVETVTFIGLHFPDVMDQVMQALSDLVADDSAVEE